MRRLVAACLTASAVLTGCATDTASDPLQVTDNLVAATPASSPPTQKTPAGTVHPTPAAQHTALDAETHTLAVADGTTLRLYDTRNMRTPPRTVELPSSPAELRADQGRLLAALPDAQQIATIDTRTAAVRGIPAPGSPVDAAQTPEGLAVALRDTKSVAFFDEQLETIRSAEHPSRSTPGFNDPTQLLPAGPDVHVLDSLATAITPIDTRTAEKGAGLRAGKGATNAVTDRYGRLLVLDTRGNTLMAFSTNQLIMKQRYPVPGAPYGIAYDPARDLAWITLTATNEVVAYDVAGGEPVERHRLPTVSQPDNVNVDPHSGKVFVTSATGQGTQVVTV